MEINNEEVYDPDDKEIIEVLNNYLETRSKMLDNLRTIIGLLMEHLVAYKDQQSHLRQLTKLLQTKRLKGYKNHLKDCYDKDI